jgi:hypothetical protein
VRTAPIADHGMNLIHARCQGLKISQVGQYTGCQSARYIKAQSASNQAPSG